MSSLIPEPRAAEAGQGQAALETTAGTVVRGGLWGTAGNVLPQVYTLAISVVAARILGSEEFGRQSFIAFVQLSTVMLLTGGLPLALMRYVGDRLGADDPLTVRRLFRWAWGLELVAAGIGAGALGLAAAAGAEPEGAWVLAAVASALGILHATPTALLLGAQRWRAAAIVGLVTGAVGTAATVAVLVAGGGITGMFAVEAAVSLANLVWTSILARRAIGEIVPPATAHRSVPLPAGVWRYAGVATIGVFLTFIVWKRSELFFLQRFSTDTEIALFSIPFAAVSALLKLPEALAPVVIASTATLAGAHAAQQINAGYSRSVRLMLPFTLGVTALALALGPEALRLTYGDEYRDTGPILLVLLAPFPLIPIMYVGSSLLIGLGRLGVPLASVAVGGTVNIVLALVLVPSYDALGAAWANAGAQVAAALIVMVFASRAVGGLRWSPRSALLSGVAGGLGGAAALASVLAFPGWTGLVLGLVAGPLVFGGVAILLRVLPAEDGDWLEQALASRPRLVRLARAAVARGGH